MSKKIRKNSGRILMTDKAKELALEYFIGRAMGDKSYTNKEIADDINKKCNLDLDESAYRKWAKSYLEGLNQGISEGAAQDYIEKIARSKIKAMQEQKIATAMRREIHTNLNDSVKIKLIQNMLLEFMANYEYQNTQFSTIKIPNNRSKKDVLVPIYIVSDIHYGVNINRTNNKYNPKIAKERLKQVADYIIKDCRFHGYKNIVLADLGDVIEGSGNLRNSQWLSTSQTLVEQAKSVVDVLTVFYSYLDDELNKIGVKAELYMVTDDNHGELRLGHSKRKEVINDNIVILIAELLFKNLYAMGDTIYTSTKKIKNKNYDIEKDDPNDAYFTKRYFNCFAGDSFIINLFKRNIYLSHGDKHKYSSNGDLVRKLSQQYHKILNIVVQGHFHSHSEVTISSSKNGNDKLIYAPCLCGDTDYASNLGFSSIPAALKLTMSRQWGHVGSELIVVK